MSLKLITAVVFSAALVAPAMAGQTISGSHSMCMNGKCTGPAHGGMTGSHDAMAGSSHAAMAGSAQTVHSTPKVVTKPH